MAERAVEQRGIGTCLGLAAVKIRTADAVDKKAVAREGCKVVEEIGRALGGVARRAQGDQLRRPDLYPVEVVERSKAKADPVVGRQVERGSSHLGEPSRARQVVGVNVCVYDRNEPPTPSLQKLVVDIWCEGCVDHRRGAV